MKNVAITYNQINSEFYFSFRIWPFNTFDHHAISMCNRHFLPFGRARPIPRLVNNPGFEEGEA
jgi:hypothetical protein